MSHVEPWAAPVSIALLEHQRRLREAAREWWVLEDERC